MSAFLCSGQNLIEAEFSHSSDRNQIARIQDQAIGSNHSAIDKYFSCLCQGCQRVSGRTESQRDDCVQTDRSHSPGISSSLGGGGPVDFHRQRPRQQPVPTLVSSVLRNSAIPVSQNKNASPSPVRMSPITRRSIPKPSAAPDNPDASGDGNIWALTSGF